MENCWSVAIEGWIILVSGVKEDAEENDIYDAFCDFGRVKDLHFNLERRTGYGKVNSIVLLWQAYCSGVFLAECNTGWASLTEHVVIILDMKLCSLVYTKLCLEVVLFGN
jgi:hypothetical protein